MASRPPVLLIACGALAREVTDLIRANGWDHLEVTCLPAHFHNTPQHIAGDIMQSAQSVPKALTVDRE